MGWELKFVVLGRDPRHLPHIVPRPVGFSKSAGAAAGKGENCRRHCEPPTGRRRRSARGLSSKLPFLGIEDFSFLGFPWNQGECEVSSMGYVWKDPLDFHGLAFKYHRLMGWL
jgi:hypothetical protein